MGALNGRADLTGLRVGVYGSGGAPWHHLAFVAAHGAEARVVRAEDVASGLLESLDVLIVPGGGAIAMAGLLGPLGEDGARAIRDWVARGGTYLASCAGSVLPLALDGEADAAMPTARCLRMVDAPLANTGDATLGGLASPGVGTIEVRLDPDHPYAAGLPGRVELVHYNGPLFDVSRAVEGVRPFAWPTAATDAFTHAEAFLPGDATPPAERVLERCIARGAANGLVAEHGDGRVVLFGSHPEFGMGPLGLGWGEGSRLLTAALAAAPRRGHAPPPPSARRAERDGVDAPTLARATAGDLRSAARRFAHLAASPAGAWLDPGNAPSFHGASAATLWERDASVASDACERAATALDAASERLDARVLPLLDDAPRDGQDFGAMGLTQLVREIHARLDGAEAALTRPPRRPAHAYDLFDAHPFHLLAASYLSAAGLAAAALLTTAWAHHIVGAEAPDLDPVLWLPPHA